MNSSILTAIESLCDDIATNTNAEDNRKRAEAAAMLVAVGIITPAEYDDEYEDDIKDNQSYDEAIKELKELRATEERRKERTILKVEKALGLTLYDWQKAFIFYDKPYNYEISNGRRTGKTLAHCLRLCLSDGEPIVATLTPPTRAENEFLRYLGEDGYTIPRSQFFISELYRVYHTLLAAGNIDLREITFGK